MKRALLIIFTLILVSCAGKAAAAERPVTFSDARVSGMGNTFTAVADDKNMLFFNPAGFAFYGLQQTSKKDAIMDPTLWRPVYNNIGDLTVVSATFGFNSNLLDKFGINNLLAYAGLAGHDANAPLYKLIDMDFFKKFQDGSLSYEEAVTANEQFIKLYYTVIHPTVNIETLSYARHYFGFGIFTSMDAVIKVEPAGFFPNLVAKMNLDLIVPVGIGMPIPGHKNWSAGITMKYFHRIRAEMNNLNDFAAVYQYIEGGYLKDDLGTVIDQTSILDMAVNGIDYTTTAIPQLKAGTGYGFDVGVMYRPTYSWKFGLLLSDVYTRINWWDRSEPSRIPVNARVGVAYMPNFSLWEIISSPVFAVDVEDIFHQQEKNFFLKWHFGTEVKFLFRLLTLRAGINEGYPSFGAGLDINFYFLSKIPFLKWLRPNRIYFPKFNPNDREFVSKNPACCCLTGLLAPLLYMHLKVDVSYTGYELGLRPGDLEDYQFLLRVSLSYSY